jgi:hypothetical protein
MMNVYFILVWVLWFLYAPPMMNVYFILVWVLWFLYALLAGAEDRATLGSDPSADTGG